MNRYIIEHPRYSHLIDPDVITVTGKTMRENLANVEPLKFNEPNGRQVIRPFENALKPTGHLTVLKGNLCPGSAVAKLTGKEGLHFEVCHLATAVPDLNGAEHVSEGHSQVF